MIIIDTDFLSSLLKIGRLNLIFEALDAKTIVITKAVLHELEQAPVHKLFLEALQSQENKIIIKEVKELSSQELGKGEMESISLAEKTKALLLINDRQAAQFAKTKGVTIMSIATFLLHCKTEKILSKEEIEQIINELKEKDYYEFSEETKKVLLE